MPTLDSAAVLALARPGGMPDEEVVARVLAGELALFEIIMRRYNQRLFRVARAIVGNESEAQDVMQEAYVRAYTHLEQFAHRAQFSTWLTRIAVNESLAVNRRSKKFEFFDPADPESAEVPAMVSKNADPERQAYGNEMRALLEAAIDELPVEYRAVFVMREIEEMNTAETAEALEVSEEVVKTRLHRGRAMLRDLLCARVGAAHASAFELHLSRCDAVVRAVFERLGAGSRRPATSP
jgi:RNA polymerase sigma-70 factor (ECF subfamily)